jgi:uncharacterized integral membrane protein
MGMIGGEDDQTGAQQRRRVSAGLVALAVAGAALVVFTVQNPDRVRVEFLAWELDLALWLLVLASAAAGALVWSGISVLRRRRRR